MKKVIALLLAAMMVFSLAACAAAPAAEAAPAETEAKKEEAAAPAAEEKKEEAAAPAAEAKQGDVNGDGKILVGYVSKNITDVFHNTINTAAVAKLDQFVADGVIDEWTGILDGETDPNKQIDLATNCITMGCDYVIMLPAESAGSDPALTSMVDAGIQVIVVNSKTDSTDDLALCYVGSDDVYAGELMGNYVMETVPDGGTYMHCQGIIGNSAQIQRGEGIVNVMDDKWTCAGDVPCEWSADKAVNAATDYIAQYGDDLKAIICDNDDMSSAVQQACNDAGRADIVCIGVDGNPGPLSMVKAGTLGATVLQDGAAQIEQGIECIKYAVEGQTVDKVYTIPFVLITKDNVDQYYTE